MRGCSTIAGPFIAPEPPAAAALPSPLNRWPLVSNLTAASGSIGLFAGWEQYADGGSVVSEDYPLATTARVGPTGDRTWTFWQKVTQQTFTFRHELIRQTIDPPYGFCVLVVCAAGGYTVQPVLDWRWSSSESTTVVALTGGWQLWTVVWQPFQGVVKVYLDAALVQEWTGLNPLDYENADGWLSLPGNPVNGGFAAVVNDWRVYDGVLDAGQVATLFSNGRNA